MNHLSEASGYVVGVGCGMIGYRNLGYSYLQESCIRSAAIGEAEFGME